MSKAPVGSYLVALVLAAGCGLPGRADDKPTVTLALDSVKAERTSGGSVLFECKVVVENKTGVELKVRSNFFSAFDGLALVVQDEKGKEIKTQAYVFHQSPMREEKAYSLATGKTIETLVFPVGDLPQGQKKFRVKITGNLPGSGNKSELESNTIEVK